MMQTFNQIARLQEQDRLRVRETESVLQVEVALSVEVETLVVGLCNPSIDRDERGSSADLARREIPEAGSGSPLVDYYGYVRKEHIEVTLQERLRRELHCTVRPI